MTEVDRLGWAVTVPLRAGEYVLGVRASTHELGELLRDAFADRLEVAADPPPNYSLWLGGPTDDGTRDLHRLYRNCTRITVSRSLRRALEALWHELDQQDVRTRGFRPMIDAVVVVHDGAVHILSRGLRARVLRDQRRWEAEGLRLIDRRWFEVDLNRGNVLVPSPTLSAEVSDLAAVVDATDGVSGSGSAQSRWLPIASWTSGVGGGGPAARLMAVAATFLDRTEHVKGQELRALASLLHQKPDHHAHLRDMSDLRRALSDI